MQDLTCGFCEKCQSKLEHLKSAENDIIKYRCTNCKKVWELHLDEKGYLCNTIVIEDK